MPSKSSSPAEKYDREESPEVESMEEENEQSPIDSKRSEVDGKRRKSLDVGSKSPDMSFDFTDEETLKTLCSEVIVLTDSR